MTFYDTSAAHAAGTESLLRRVGSRLRDGMRVVQYGRMMHVLSELSDENLKVIGLERADIPRHAHYCIYGTYS